MEEKSNLKNFLERTFEMKLKDLVYVLLMVIVSSAVFGFIYETIFYRFDLGYFVKRGTTYGPWIPIYAFGGLFITLITYYFRKKPLVVFSLSCIISGILEFATGYVLFHLFNLRLWDYNVEILNFGNIGGYICFRSIAFFGLSGLFLVYGLIPQIRKIYSNKIVKCITIVLATMFFADVIISTLT